MMTTFDESRTRRRPASATGTPTLREVCLTGNPARRYRHVRSGDMWLARSEGPIGRPMAGDDPRIEAG